VEHLRHRLLHWGPLFLRLRHGDGENFVDALFLGLTLVEVGVLGKLREGHRMLVLRGFHFSFLLVFSGCNMCRRSRSCVVRERRPKVCLIALLLRHFVSEEPLSLRLTHLPTGACDRGLRLLALELSHDVADREHGLVLVQ
jgi:hypothetical protein